MAAGMSRADLALTTTPDGVVIAVRVVPRAGRTALDGVVEGALRVRLAASPVEGTANRALVEFLAGLLGVPQRDVTIARGERGRQKVVLVRGLDATGIRQRLPAQE